VLPSTLSGKFAFSCFYFPDLMFYILTESKGIFPKRVKSRGLRFVLIETSGCEVVYTLIIRNPSPFAEMPLS